MLKEMTNYAAKVKWKGSYKGFPKFNAEHELGAKAIV
jgi:hypothetical protein